MSKGFTAKQKRAGRELLAHTILSKLRGDVCQLQDIATELQDRPAGVALAIALDTLAWANIRDRVKVVRKS